VGTWGTGPFDNDDAADFAADLEDSQAGDPVRVVTRVLTDTMAARDYLEADLGAEAVAAAALLAAQCPGGDPIGPEGPHGELPTFPDTLRPLAVRALDRVLADDSELTELWAESDESDGWRSGILRLRGVLADGENQPVG
jgi:hypothetical protein